MTISNARKNNVQGFDWKPSAKHIDQVLEALTGLEMQADHISMYEPDRKEFLELQIRTINVWLDRYAK